MRHIDTAHAYGFSEEKIGAFFRKHAHLIQNSSSLSLSSVRSATCLCRTPVCVRTRTGRRQTGQILTHLSLWPAPAHSPPVAGYPVPSARQRVARRDQGVRSGPAKSSRWGPRTPGSARRPSRGDRAAPLLPLTSTVGAQDTPREFRGTARAVGEPARAGSCRGSGGAGTWIVARPPRANSYH